MEKRRFSRICLKMTADLTVNEQRYSFPRVANISIGGCRLESGAIFDQGAACRFWLPLEPTEPNLGVEVFGEIVRCDGETVSVRFTRIDPNSLFMLQNILRYNASDPEKIEEEISEHPGLI